MSDCRLLHCTECVVDCVADSPIDEVISILIPAIQELIENENPDIGDAMVVMIPDFVDQIVATFPEEANDIIITHILPILHTCFEMGTDQVAESYVTIVRSLPIEFFVSTEIPQIVEICGHPDEFVRQIVPAILGFLAGAMDAKLWCKEALDFFNILSKDADAGIRAKLPSLITVYSKMLNGPKERAQLTGKFSLLCRDHAEEVRKSAAEAIVALSEVNDPLSRLVTVVPAARLLLNDASATVRSLTTRNLGPLIASIGEKCDAVIVNKFSAALSSTDLGLCFSAAYAFPAVALVLGTRRFSELAAGFEAVVNSPEYRVRRTIAFGLFEYASVLPVKELTEAVVSFLKDVPTVSIGIFAHFHQLLPVLPNPGSFLSYLQNPEGQKDWRVRLEISKQTRLCLPFYDRIDLLKIARTLATDSVWKVRKDGAQSVATLMEEEDLLFVIRLAKGGKSVERLAAAWIIERLNHELVLDVVVQRLRGLIRDKVANVRAAAARAISAHAAAVPALKELVQTARLDGDPDVRQG